MLVKHNKHHQTKGVVGKVMINNASGSNGSNYNKMIGINQHQPLMSAPAFNGDDGTEEEGSDFGEM